MLTLPQRVPISLQIVFALISLSGMMCLPDTPRWYYDRSRGMEGDSVLSRLHDLPIDHSKVQKQKREILTSISLEHQETAKFQFTSLFWDNTDLRFGRRIRTVFLIQMFQQLMGKSFCATDIHLKAVANPLKVST